MPQELDDEQKREIPTADTESGWKEIDVKGKSILDIVNETLSEFVSKLKDLEARVASLEKE